MNSQLKKMIAIATVSLGSFGLFSVLGSLIPSVWIAYAWLILTGLIIGFLAMDELGNHLAAIAVGDLLFLGANYLNLFVTENFSKQNIPVGIWLLSLCLLLPFLVVGNVLGVVVANRTKLSKRR